MAEIEDQVKTAFNNVDNKNKYWALMLFNTELELGISNTPGKWVNTRNLFFTDGFTALEAYSNTPNPASQLVDGKTPEELVQNMNDMVVCYGDNKWLEENLYPYL